MVSLNFSGLYIFFRKTYDSIEETLLVGTSTGLDLIESLLSVFFSLIFNRGTVGAPKICISLMKFSVH